MATIAKASSGAGCAHTPNQCIECQRPMCTGGIVLGVLVRKHSTNEKPVCLAWAALGQKRKYVVPLGASLDPTLYVRARRGNQAVGDAAGDDAKADSVKGNGGEWCFW